MFSKPYLLKIKYPQLQSRDLFKYQQLTCLKMDLNRLGTRKHWIAINRRLEPYEKTPIKFQMLIKTSKSKETKI